MVRITGLKRVSFTGHLASNSKEFKLLYLKYKAITMAELRAAVEQPGVQKYMIDTGCELGEAAMGYLTGYATENCILCLKTSRGCKDCYWEVRVGTGCRDHETFTNIGLSKTEEELYEAIQERMRYMRQFIVKFK